MDCLATEFVTCPKVPKEPSEAMFRYHVSTIVCLRPWLPQKPASLRCWGPILPSTPGSCPATGPWMFYRGLIQFLHNSVAIEPLEKAPSPSLMCCPIPYSMLLILQICNHDFVTYHYLDPDGSFNELSRSHPQE